MDKNVVFKYLSRQIETSYTHDLSTQLRIGSLVDKPGLSDLAWARYSGRILAGVKGPWLSASGLRPPFKKVKTRETGETQMHHNVHF